MPNSYAGQADSGSGSSKYNELAFMFKRLIARIRTMDLVEVISCTNTGTVAAVGMVNVKVLTNQMTGDRDAVPHGTIYNVPYQRIQGGANAVILDPQAGDIGMCGFCARDISQVKIAKAAADPGSYRMFDWADGLYLGGFLNGTPTSYVQFTNDGKINMVSPSQISMTVGAHSVVVSTSAVTIDGKVFLTHQHTGVSTGSGDSGGVL